MSLQRYSDILDRFGREGQRRIIPPDRMSMPHIDMTSNDYLGLAQEWASYMPGFLDKYPDASFSSSASRLLSCRQRHHIGLERLLSHLYGKEVLIFNSGYHANVGIIQALNIPGTIFLCDKLVHASMIDGLMLANAEFRRWRHNDVESLSRLLDRHNGRHCIVVLESVYSMDGDVAPLRAIVELKRRYPDILLYVDEAHAFGTRGERGLGISEEENVIDDIDIIVGTFGKALASAGAFAATSGILKEFFINCSRSFIFSTALPPANSAWSMLMIEKMVTMREERRHLAFISQKFRKGIEEFTGKQNGSQSHIVPLITGDSVLAQLLAQRLSDRGIDAMPIRRPTVPPGGERIRFSLSASMTIEEIDHVLEIIKDEYLLICHES